MWRSLAYTPASLRRCHELPGRAPPCHKLPMEMGEQCCSRGAARARERRASPRTARVVAADG
eukprot:354327-Prymnesium_polylepis.1